MPEPPTNLTKCLASPDDQAGIMVEICIDKETDAGFQRLLIPDTLQPASCLVRLMKAKAEAKEAVWRRRAPSSCASRYH